MQFENYALNYDEVRNVIKDSEGFIWIATRNGLFKYDGYKFKPYYHDNSNPRSISNNAIWALLEDKFKNLWIGTENGLNRYDRSTDGFEVYKPGDQNSGLLRFEVLALAADRNGNVWAGATDGGISRISFNSETHTCALKSFKKEKDNPFSISSNNSWTITFDKNNFGWVGNNESGISVFNASLPDDKIQFKNIANDPDSSESISNNKTQQVYYDEDKNIVWVCSDKGALDIISYRDNPLDETVLIRPMLPRIIAQVNIKSLGVKYFLTDSKKNYWFGSESNGLFSFSLSGQSFETYQATGVTNFVHAATNSKSIIGDQVLSLYEDDLHGLWIGTTTGVSRFNYFTTLFQSGISKNVFKKLLNVTVNAVLQDASGGTWLGGTDGIVYYNFRDTLREINIRKESDKIKNLNTLSINCMLINSRGDLIIGGIPRLVVVRNDDLQKWIDKKKEKLNAWIAPNPDDSTPYILRSRNYMSLLEASDHSVWIGSGTGLYKMNPVTNEFTEVSFLKNLPSLAQRVRALIEFIPGQIWIGTDIGLFAYDFKKEQPVDLKGILIGDTGMLTDYIRCFARDEAGNLWIGAANGLYRYVNKERKIEFKTLHETVISGIIPYRKHLWISTNSGIYNYDIENGKIINYDESDGLSISRFNYQSCCKLNNGALVFGNVKGINAFFPDSLSRISYSSPVKITDFKIQDKSIWEDANNPKMTGIIEGFNTGRTVTLGSDQNYFSFEFANLNFLSTAKNRYQYKLEGLDTGWVSLDKSNAANFTNLPSLYRSVLIPGVYKFLVRSTDGYGNQSYLDAPVTISIKPPFTRSIEFFSLLAIAFLTVTIYVVRYLSQQKLKEQLREREKLLAIERERNRISEDLHDDLGAGLSSIAMMTGVMKDLVTDDESKVTAEDVSTEANELVSRMREIIWSMNSKNDTLENLITYLQEYSNKYLNRNKIECALQMTGQIPEKNIPGDKRENIFLVMKETLHNIVKYADTPRVNVDVTINSGELQIKVFDNGKGFDMNNIKRFGNGLDNMKHRIENIGGAYIIESSPGQGTSTKIKVPIS